MHRFWMASALLMSCDWNAQAAGLEKQPASDVQLSKPDRHEGGGVGFSIAAMHCLEATVTLEAQLRGLKPSHPLPWTFVLAGKPEQLELEPDGSGDGRTHFDVTYRWRPGGMGARHDPSAVYRLPYPPQRHWVVSQGNFGRFSHGAGSGDEYSIDWAMPSGSPVCAARGGRVIAVKQNSTVNGLGHQFDVDANYILVRHADGTCGEYVHLETDGAAVNVGQDVEVGQVIGSSGNTGNSSEPHLHFGVFTNRDGFTRTSIPVRWQTRRGATDRLIEGRQY
ncbi:MAG TPA: M23 family metallopeptidase [Pirellulales bacterium]